MYNTIYYKSDMMIRMNHYGNNKRCKGSMAVYPTHRSDMVLGMVNQILQEKMIKENYSTDDIGDSMISGWKLVRDLIGFFLFIMVMMFSIGVGTIISLIVFGVVFLMYLWDTSKFFWKNLKKT